MKDNEMMQKIVTLLKRRGFIYQGSDIYDGLAGTWDYGPLGVLLKNNIKNIWWKMFVQEEDNMFGLDAAILMNSNTWKASGHVDGFVDPLVEDLKNKKRYRADHLIESNGLSAEGLNAEQMDSLIKEKGIKSPDGNDLGEVRQFNMMFETSIGAVKDSSSVVYLRPETAQGIFVNFKNVVDSFHPKLPFGIAQIGKAFRNEITPRDFIFRVREFEQMEIEYFTKPERWQEDFEMWQANSKKFFQKIGLKEESIHELEVPQESLAHYSKRTIDFEFDFPFGRKELSGLAYRTDFDLTSHQAKSGVDLSYFDQEKNERYTPHVIEPSFGLDRAVCAVITSSYQEEMVGEEERIVLKLPIHLAPISIAVLPLSKKEELSVPAHEIHRMLRANWMVDYDESQSIGKRYRRQDEIGTPFCITVDFDTLKDQAVTVRDRDTMQQERIEINNLETYFKQKLA